VALVYLLDSSVCVPVLRGRSSISDLPIPTETAVSSIVAAELWTGVCKLGEDHPQLAYLAEFLEVFAVLDFSHDAARHYGELRVDLEKRGVVIGPLDMLIAAHARSLGATLITANAGEFKRVKGLKVLAWR
jgi:tRNA(fMet)-specific endonuclease VapC